MLPLLHDALKAERDRGEALGVAESWLIVNDSYLTCELRESGRAVHVEMTALAHRGSLRCSCSICGERWCGHATAAVEAIFIDGPYSRPTAIPDEAAHHEPLPERSPIRIEHFERQLENLRRPGSGPETLNLEGLGDLVALYRLTASRASANRTVGHYPELAAAIRSMRDRAVHDSSGAINPATRTLLREHSMCAVAVRDRSLDALSPAPETLAVLAFAHAWSDAAGAAPILLSRLRPALGEQGIDIIRGRLLNKRSRIERQISGEDPADSVIELGRLRCVARGFSALTGEIEDLAIGALMPDSELLEELARGFAREQRFDRALHVAAKGALAAAQEAEFERARRLEEFELLCLFQLGERRRARELARERFCSSGTVRDYRLAFALEPCEFRVERARYDIGEVEADAARDLVDWFELQ